MKQTYFDMLQHTRNPARAALLIRAMAADLAATWPVVRDTPAERLDTLRRAVEVAAMLDRAQPGDPWRTWLRTAGYLRQLAPKRRRRYGCTVPSDAATATGMYDHD